MTKEQCENIIIGLMKTIREVYHEYNPDGKYLALAITENISANNSYWGENKDRQLAVTLFEDGTLGRTCVDDNGQLRTEYEGAIKNAG